MRAKKVRWVWCCSTQRGSRSRSSAFAFLVVVLERWGRDEGNVTGVRKTVPDRHVVRSRRQADYGGERGLNPQSRKERHVSGRVEQALDRTTYG